MKNSKQAFTLVEILGVVALIGILTVGTAVSVNRIWQNNRIDICESELRDMTTAFKSYFTDYGNIIVAPDTNYQSVLDETAEILNKKYLSYEIKVCSIADDKKSVRFETKLKDDPWNNKYEVYIYTYEGDDATSVPGMIVITSKGADGQDSRDTYSSGEYGDDIIAVVEPNI